MKTGRSGVRILSQTGTLVHGGRQRLFSTLLLSVFFWWRQIAYTRARSRFIRSLLHYPRCKRVPVDPLQLEFCRPGPCLFRACVQSCKRAEEEEVDERSAVRGRDTRERRENVS